MAKNTARDKIWTIAMRSAIEQKKGANPLKIKHVRNQILEDVSDRTIRDVLNTMVAHRWLAKENEQSHTWMPGPALDEVQLEELAGDRVAGVDAMIVE